MKGYGSAWCQHLDPFDSLGEDLNEFIGKNGYSVYWADRGRTGRRLMEHLLHHRRLPSPLVYFSWCYLQWRHWVGFSSSHPWNLYGSLLRRNSAQPYSEVQRVHYEYIYTHVRYWINQILIRTRIWCLGHNMRAWGFPRQGCGAEWGC